MHGKFFCAKSYRVIIMNHINWEICFIKSYNEYVIFVFDRRFTVSFTATVLLVISAISSFTVSMKNGAKKERNACFLIHYSCFYMMLQALHQDFHYQSTKNEVRIILR